MLVNGIRSATREIERLTVLGGMTSDVLVNRNSFVRQQNKARCVKFAPKCRCQLCGDLEVLLEEDSLAAGA